MKFGERIKSFFRGIVNNNNAAITDEMFDDLCDLLVEGDFGAA